MSSKIAKVWMRKCVGIVGKTHRVRLEIYECGREMYCKCGWRIRITEPMMLLIWKSRKPPFCGVCKHTIETAPKGMVPAIDEQIQVGER